eukprot:PhF_6_TR33634/c1_g2_i3/m.49153/K07359/CAMKK2; calcium/calmodulin-dependent protein kinase kinase 2
MGCSWSAEVSNVKQRIPSSKLPTKVITRFDADLYNILQAPMTSDVVVFDCDTVPDMNVASNPVSDCPSSKPRITFVVSQNDLLETPTPGCLEDDDDDEGTTKLGGMFMKSISSGGARTECESNVSVTSAHEIVHGVDCDGNKLVNEYLVVATLGKGSFGKVKLAIDTKTEKGVAIKVLKRDALEKQARLMGGGGGFGYERGISAVHQEIEIMKSCRHPNLVRLLHVIRDPADPKLYMVMEYMEGGVLATTPALIPPVSVSQAPVHMSNLESIRRSFRDVLFGLQFLHSKGVIHMDIKPENILIGKDGTCKLADFGVSLLLKQYDDTVNIVQGTPLYYAPEMITKGGSFHGRKTDVWALGVTLYVCAFKALPFEGFSLSEYHYNVQTKDVAFPSWLEDQTDSQIVYFKDAVRRMLHRNPTERINVVELLGHPFFVGEPTQQPMTASTIHTTSKVPLSWWVKTWREQK